MIKLRAGDTLDAFVRRNLGRWATTTYCPRPSVHRGRVVGYNDSVGLVTIETGAGWQDWSGGTRLLPDAKDGWYVRVEDLLFDCTCPTGSCEGFCPWPQSAASPAAAGPAKDDRFPHTCPRCAAPAYLGLLRVECSREGCA